MVAYKSHLRYSVDLLSEPWHDKTNNECAPSEDSDHAQADLSLCWVHSHFVGFVMSRLILCL